MRAKRFFSKELVKKSTTDSFSLNKPLGKGRALNKEVVKHIDNTWTVDSVDKITYETQNKKVLNRLVSDNFTKKLLDSFLYKTLVNEFSKILTTFIRVLN